MSLKSLSSGGAYNRYLGQNGFRGVDFTSHPSMVHPDRFADAVNVWRDYRSGQGSAIETFPGYRACTKIIGAEGYSNINGIYRYRLFDTDYILIHSGYKLIYATLDNLKSSSGITELTSPTKYMANRRSRGWQYGDSFYIIDGEHYYKISHGGDSLNMKKASDYAYVPTTYIDGAEHEQRNMLKDEVKETFTITKQGDIIDFSEHLIFTVSGNICSVSGIKTDDSFPSYPLYIKIPSKTTVNDTEYDVTKIDDNAFSLNNLSYTDKSTAKIEYLDAPSITYVGKYAFKNCTALKTVNLPNVSIIDQYAFYGCTNLNEMFVGSSGSVLGYALYGSGLSKIYTSAAEGYFDYDVSTDLSYEQSEEDAEGTYNTWHNATKIYSTQAASNNFIFSIPVFDIIPSDPIYTLKDSKNSVFTKGISGIGKSYYMSNDHAHIFVFGENDSSFLGETFTLNHTVKSSEFSSSKHTAFLSSASGYTGTALNAILNCTVCSQFDDRIFFTGNPNLPNTVFYTQRDSTGHNNPLYIGTYNYFNTGVGSSPNVAMIAAGSNLVVFKEDTVQDGSVNLYQGAEGPDDILPRVYVRQQGLSGIGCLGAACNFADDLVFISSRGLDAVGTQAVNLERSIQHRSTNIDRKLLAEDLSHASLSEWQGYLILLTPQGRAYIADSRQTFGHSSGIMQYEWYFLDDIGSYSGDTDVYAFSSVLPEDISAFSTAMQDELKIHDSPDTMAHGVVSSVGDGDGKVYYIFLDGNYYSVYPTGEKAGGAFCPATCIENINDNLFFGTTDGTVCVFNTDKRGEMPPLDIMIGMNADEYGEKYGDIIPRQYYNHMYHRYLSYVALAQENAGIPHLSKSTVKRSVVLKAKDMFGSVFKYNVKTDREPFGDAPEIAASMPDFADSEFGSYVLDTSNDGSIISIPERKKRYVEKQYAFFSDDYCRPFGIYNITYQYQIQGKVKNR